MWPSQTETKAIACGLVLGGVILEVRPKVGGKRVALVHFGFRPNGVVSFGFFTAILRMEDARHGWLVIGKMDIIKSEVRLLTKADNQNALAVLRYKVCSIHHLVAYVIPEFFFQDLFDHTRSEEHTSELKSLMRNSYAVFCWKKKNKIHSITKGDN